MKQFKLAIFFLCLTTLTHANTPHIHGEATASIIIENKKVTIALSIPSESVVGFEHSPTTDDEVQRIQAATKKLQSSSLFEFYKLSGFFKNQTNIQPVKRSIEINSSQKEQATKHNDHHHHDHDHNQVKTEQESHSEFDIQINYTFYDTSKIKEIKSNLIEFFPLLKKIDIIVIMDTNQNEFTLTKNQTTIEINTNE